DQCLVDCYAIMELRNPTASSFALDDSTLDLWYEKASGAKDLVDLRLQILENVSYNVTVSDYENITYNLTCDVTLDYGLENKSASCVSESKLVWEQDYESVDGKTVYWTQREKVGSHLEERTKLEFVDFDPVDKMIENGKTYTLKIVGKKKPTLRSNNVDWKIRLLGQYEPDWAWWNDSWSYLKPINISQTGSSSLTDFPAYVVVDTQSLISAGKMQSDCDDIRFVSSDNTSELDWGFVNKGDATYGCNTSDTTLVVETDIPSSGTTIYMYYGNPSASAVDNLADALDSNYEQVIFFKEGTGTSLTADSSSNSRNFSFTSIESDDWVSGEFDYGLDMDGDGEFAQSTYVGDNSDYSITICLDGVADQYNYLVANGGGGGYLDLKYMGSGTGIKIQCDDGTIQYVNNINLSDGSYHCISQVFDDTANTLKGYGDGVEDVSFSQSSCTDAGWDTNIGVRLDINTAESLDGTVDRFYFSGIVRSADWVKREYRQDLFNVGAEETETGGGADGYIKADEDICLQPGGTKVIIGTSDKPIKLEMYSPDGTAHCCYVNNSASWVCSAGTC
ncbi:MAG: DUF2341 domain-containing protein, partial [Candidatus Altiarchaeota archaeon]